jgi:hypothetical protein
MLWVVQDYEESAISFGRLAVDRHPTRELRDSFPQLVLPIARELLLADVFQWMTLAAASKQCQYGQTCQSSPKDTNLDIAHGPHAIRSAW